jgi:hypothetical protein
MQYEGDLKWHSSIRGPPVESRRDTRCGGPYDARSPQSGASRLLHLSLPCPPGRSNAHSRLTGAPSCRFTPTCQYHGEIGDLLTGSTLLGTHCYTTMSIKIGPTQFLRPGPCLTLVRLMISSAMKAETWPPLNTCLGRLHKVALCLDAGSSRAAKPRISQASTQGSSRILVPPPSPRHAEGLSAEEPQSTLGFAGYFLTWQLGLPSF